MGRKAKSNKIKGIRNKIAGKKNGKPDFEFMEKYIKVYLIHYR